LPYINDLLEKAGSPKRYKNLFGVTLGTGFGGGIVLNGNLLDGDNSISGEVWLLRNRLDRGMNAEEGASIRAVRRAFAEKAGIPFEQAPEPKEICDAMGNALTLVDGLAVIGGGISAAWNLFLPAIVEELNGFYIGPEGRKFRRLASAAFNLEDSAQMESFLKGETREIAVPGSRKKIAYDPLQRVGVGISRLGTTEAVAMGAYAFALHKLDLRS
jgi:glucokinase